MTSPRSPYEVAPLTPEQTAWLRAPHLPARLIQAVKSGEISREHFEALGREVAQAGRVDLGHREQMGSYLNNPQFPKEALPYAPKEQRRPGRTDEDHETLAQAQGQIATAHMTMALQQKLSQSDRPSSEYQRDNPDRPPSLRESVSGAVDALGG